MWPACLMIAAVIFIPGTCFITYMVSCQLGHIDPILPWISETYMFPPESCIFAQLGNFGFLSAVLIGHVRARQLSTHVSSSPHCARLNKASFCMGLLSAVGMTVAANYPEIDSPKTSIEQIVNYTHMAGAVVAFGFAIIYCWMDVALSFITRRQLSSMLVCLARVTYALIPTASFIFIAVIYATGLVKEEKYLKYGALSQWAMMASITAYFLTFFNEFRRFGKEKSGYETLQ